MAEPVATVSVGVMKGLVQLVNSNQLTVAALEKAAAGANMSVGELLLGIQAQQGGPVGAARSAARTLFTAVSRLPEASQLQTAMSNAARQAAGQLVEKGGELIARQSAKELALTAGRMTKTALIKIATKVGQLIVQAAGKLGPIGSAITILVIGLILLKLIGVLGEQMADKPVEPGSRVAGGNSSNASSNSPLDSLPGSSLPGSGHIGTASPGLTGQVAPASVDKKSFHGIWVQPAYIHGGLSRAVFVQSGSSITGRIEINGAIHGQNGKILIASGTYELSGTIDADNKMTFTLGKFTGDVTISRTGMSISGYMNAPGGHLLGYAVNLDRQLVASR